MPTNLKAKRMRDSSSENERNEKKKEERLEINARAQQ